MAQKRPNAQEHCDRSAQRGHQRSDQHGRCAQCDDERCVYRRESLRQQHPFAPISVYLPSLVDRRHRVLPLLPHRYHHDRRRPLYRSSVHPQQCAGLRLLRRTLCAGRQHLSGEARENGRADEHGHQLRTVDEDRSNLRRATLGRTGAHEGQYVGTPQGGQRFARVPSEAKHNLFGLCFRLHPGHCI